MLPNFNKIYIAVNEKHICLYLKHYNCVGSFALNKTFMDEYGIDCLFEFTYKLTNHNMTEKEFYLLQNFIKENYIPNKNYIFYKPNLPNITLNLNFNEFKNNFITKELIE